jgi:lysophospholipase L1-like esterase
MARRILCYGDSNTWGYDPDGNAVSTYFVRYPWDVRWTGVLQTLLGDGYVVIEEGLNGRSTVWDDPIVPYRNGIAHIEACIDSQSPLDLVIVMLGTNDFKPKISGRASDIADGVGALVQKIQRSTCGRNGGVPEILIVSPILIGEDITSSMHADEFGGVEVHKESMKLAAYLENIAAAQGTHFLDAAKVADPYGDAIHLNQEGHAKLAAALEQKIKEIL